MSEVITSTGVRLRAIEENGEVQECYVGAPGLGEPLPVDPGVCASVPSRVWKITGMLPGRRVEKFSKGPLFAVSLRTPEGGVEGCVVARYDVESGGLYKVADVDPSVCEALPARTTVKRFYGAGTTVSVRDVWGELSEEGMVVNPELAKQVVRGGWGPEL